MSTRALAWFAIGAQVVFVAAWLVAGAAQPGYSPARSTISALAAEGAAHPWIVMAGLAVFGAGVLALAVAVARTLPARPATYVAVGLFAVAGLALIAAAFVRLPCDPARAACSGGAAHGVMAILAQLAILLSPFALARAAWPGALARGALIAGGLIVAIGLFDQSLMHKGVEGTIERVGLTLDQVWLVLVAAGVLVATRRRRRSERGVTARRSPAPVWD